MFDVLRHKYRRRLLLMLAETNSREIDGVAPTAIAKDDDDLDMLTRELHHVHLPKLDDAGFISWDRGTNTVSRGALFQGIEPPLKLMDEHRDELPGDWP